MYMQNKFAHLLQGNTTNRKSLKESTKSDVYNNEKCKYLFNIILSSFKIQAEILKHKQ